MALALLLTFSALEAGLNARTSAEESFGKALVQKNCAGCHAIG
jgi:mono/diheme cytochrome c family protein